MDVFIYFFEPLEFGRDEISDSLKDALMGIGMVTGGGDGEMGSNIDLLIEDWNISREQVMRLVRNALQPFSLPKSTTIVVDGEKFLI